MSTATILLTLNCLFKLTLLRGHEGSSMDTARRRPQHCFIPRTPAPMGSTGFGAALSAQPQDWGHQFLGCYYSGRTTPSLHLRQVSLVVGHSPLSLIQHFSQLLPKKEFISLKDCISSPSLCFFSLPSLQLILPYLMSWERGWKWETVKRDRGGCRDWERNFRNYATIVMINIIITTYVISIFNRTLHKSVSPKS